MAQIQETQQVSVDWLDEEKTIIYTKVYDWNWKDLNYITQEGCAMQDTVSHGTYFVVDVTEATHTIPQGAIHHIRDLVDTAHPNDCLIILVGANEIMKVLLNTVGRIYRFAGIIQKYRFVRTLDEALVMVEAHKAGVPV